MKKKYYMLLNPSTREDDDMVHLCHNKTFDERVEVFKKHIFLDFKDFKIVKFEPHSGCGELEGYLIIEIDKKLLKDSLQKLKPLLTLTDESWGFPYYYFVLFELSGNLDNFHFSDVDTFIYNNKNPFSSYFSKVILSNHCGYEGDIEDKINDFLALYK